MNKINQFWDERAKLGENAGSNDFILKQLEQKVIFENIPYNSNVLEVGCGNGDTLTMLAKKKNIKGVGFDFSDGMINLAKESLEKNNLIGQIDFYKGKVPGLAEVPNASFDFVLSERCLINLENSDEQRKAFEEIMSKLKPKGRYLMIESFLQGLNDLNNLRSIYSLEPITPPWHNVFFNDEEVIQWQNEKYKIIKTDYFASSYYFVSRVIYAAFAQENNEQLEYDSKLNLISSKLPPIGNLGPVKLVLWEKQ